MFSAIIRVTALLIAGSIISLVMMSAGGMVADVTTDLGDTESNNSDYIRTTATWFPAIVIATAVIALIASAVFRRGQVG